MLTKKSSGIQIVLGIGITGKDNITDTDNRQGIKDNQSFNFIAANFFE